MKDEKRSNKKQDKPMTEAEKERRLAISMMRLWAKKYPNDFKRIAKESSDLSANPC